MDFGVKQPGFKSWFEHIQAVLPCLCFYFPIRYMDVNYTYPLYIMLGLN